ncbi:hypothetical protein OSTOST_15070 [Ostertagia ostertagi]
MYSRTVRSDIVHPNVERSLGESFSMRRSPKDSPARWTDIFTSKNEFERRLIKHFRESHHGDDDRSPVDEMVCATEELQSLSTSELNGRVEQVLRDRNLDQKKIDEVLVNMQDEQKRLILTQHLKTDVSGTKKSPKMMIDDLLAVLDSKNVLDKKGDVVTLRVALGGETVKYLSEVRDDFLHNLFVQIS